MYYVMKIVRYKKEKTMQALGKNGFMHCNGLKLDIMESKERGKILTFYPITSKRRVGRCRIEVPAEHIDDVIKELNELKKQLKTLQY